MSTKFLEGIRVGEFMSSLNNTSRQNLRSGGAEGRGCVWVCLINPWACNQEKLNTHGTWHMRFMWYLLAKNTWCAERGGKKKKNESSLEAMLHGCRELLDKKWTLNEQSMVQTQKVLSKHRALNQIVLHNHYYQKHALKKKFILGLIWIFWTMFLVLANFHQLLT